MQISQALFALIGSGAALALVTPDKGQGGLSPAGNGALFAAPTGISGSKGVHRRSGSGGDPSRMIQARYTGSQAKVYMVIFWLSTERKKYFEQWEERWIKRRNAMLQAARRYGVLDDDDIAEFFTTNKEEPTKEQYSIAQRAVTQKEYEEWQWMLSRGTWQLHNLDPDELWTGAD